MSFWDFDWFNLRKVAALQKQLSDSAALLAESRSNFTICQSDTSRLSITNRDLNQKIVALNTTIANKDAEIQALKDAQNGTEADLAKAFSEIVIYQDNIFVLHTQVKDLQAQLEEANKKPLPPGLTELGTYIKTLKGTAGFDNPKLWYDCLKSLFIVFGKPEITDSIMVTAGEVEAKIKAAFPGIPLPPMKDNKYKLIKIDQAMAITKGSYNAIGKWIEEFFDCDKFAQSLRDFFAFYYLVNSCAEVWGIAAGPHSWNIIVCSDGLLSVEPQNNQIMVFPEVLYTIEQVHDL